MAPFIPAVLALTAGAVVAAVAGIALFGRLSDAQLERTILILLLVIGIALIVEGFLPQTGWTLLPKDVTFWIVAGVLFAYGVDIKTAGTASLLISLPTVAVGIARYARRSAYSRAAIAETVVPMGIGSVLGAVINGLLVGVVPSAVLKLGLGFILIVSAWRTFRHMHK